MPGNARRVAWSFGLLLLGAGLGVGAENLRARPWTPPAEPFRRPVALRPSSWDAAPSAHALARFRDAAFAAGGTLSTDGEHAVFEPGDGASRPLDVPVPIPRVLAAGGRLFASGTNEGAPFLIALARDEEPRVVPMPCSVRALAAAGKLVVGSCDEGNLLALSVDGAVLFRGVPLELPAPLLPDGVAAERAIEAVGVDVRGNVGFVVLQRWRDAKASLQWSWAHAGVRTGPDVRMAVVPGLARAFGIHVSDGTATVVGLEIVEGEEGPELRPRFWMGSLGAPLLPVGTAGPRCGEPLEAAEAQGLLLGPGHAGVLCEGRIVSSLDTGTSWRPEPEITGATLLEGGDMKLLVRAGDRVFLRSFALRSEQGATAVRVERGMPSLGAGNQILELPPGIREPSLDGGADVLAGP